MSGLRLGGVCCAVHKVSQECQARAEAEIVTVGKQITAERDAFRHKLMEERKKFENEKLSTKTGFKLEQARLKRELDLLEAERRKVVDTNIGL